MRKTLFIAFAALLSSTLGRAENNTADVQTAGTDGVACFVNLMTPEYPKAALAAKDEWRRAADSAEASSYHPVVVLPVAPALQEQALQCHV